MTRFTLGVLIASIALNFALAGYLIGKESAPPPVFDPTRSYIAWSRTLEDERFRELRAVMRDHAPRGHRPMRDLRIQNRALLGALRDPDFDSQRIAAALTGLRRSQQAAQERSHGAFVAFVSALTPEERMSLAEDMQRRRIRPDAPHRRR